ncbi:hypothetical protein G6F61_014562 [Rhizopus arrhizus]|nr:hypothetical protein G6F61_014562 [Rhizopus arrhizus]
MQMQHHVGITLPEFLDDGRQRVARLRMRGRDRQHALAAVGVFRARMPDVVGALQDLLHQRQDQLTGRRQTDQPLARAHEDVDTHLFFQLAYLAADAGLGRMQAFGNVGQVEVLAHGFAHRPQLLEIHRAPSAQKGQLIA